MLGERRAGGRGGRGWVAGVKVEGTLDFALVGILASISAPLAEAGVPVFAISTFDTDYVFVKEETLERAKSALSNAGHEFVAEAPARCRPTAPKNENFMRPMLAVSALKSRGHEISG